MEYSTNGILAVFVIFLLCIGIDSFNYNNYRTKRMFVNVAANNDYGKQVYGVTTYDALFKSVFNEVDIRASFFKSFIPELNIITSTRLDENMNPRKEYQSLRKFMSNKSNLKTVESLKSSEIEVGKKDKDGKLIKYLEGTAFVNGFLELYGDIMKGFPKEGYNGAMDFVCELDTGDYVLVETKVVPQVNWDRRVEGYYKIHLY